MKAVPRWTLVVLGVVLVALGAVYLFDLTRTHGTLTVTAQHEPGLHLVAKDHSGPAESVPATIEAVRAWATEAGIACPRTFVQYADATPPAPDAPVNATAGCVVAAQPREAPPPGLTYRRIPAGLCVVGTIEPHGSPDRFAHYAETARWAAAHGHRVAPTPIELRETNDRGIRVTYLFHVQGGSPDVSIADPRALEFHEVYREHRGDYRQLVQLIYDVRRWAASSGIECTRTFGQYLDDPGRVKTDDLRSLGGCLVPGPVATEKLPPGFQYRHVPSASYAVAAWKGAGPVDHAQLYATAYGWIGTHRYKLEGPVTELYDHSMEPEVKTEWHFPVEALGGTSPEATPP